MVIVDVYDRLESKSFGVFEFETFETRIFLLNKNTGFSPLHKREVVVNNLFSLYPKNRYRKCLNSACVESYCL